MNQQIFVNTLFLNFLSVITLSVINNQPARADTIDINKIDLNQCVCVCVHVFVLIKLIIVELKVSRSLH